VHGQRSLRNNCLRQHCHTLFRTLCRSDLALLKETYARIFRVLETRSRVFLDIHPGELAIVAAVARLGAYADQWLRQPEDWQANADEEANSLMAMRAYRGETHVEELMRLLLRYFVRHCIKFITALLQTNGHVLTKEQIQLAAQKAEISRLSASRLQPMSGCEPLNATWRIEELCSMDDLKTEGKPMNYCVEGYVRRCRHGTSAIFSLRRLITDSTSEMRSRSYATIEVHPAQKKMVQICAHSNRSVNNSTMNLIRSWAGLKGLA
jgi:hypothetical protein